MLKMVRSIMGMDSYLSFLNEAGRMLLEEYESASNSTLKP